MISAKILQTFLALRLSCNLFQFKLCLFWQPLSMLRQYISLPFCILQMDERDPLWEESSLIAEYRESPRPGPTGTNMHGPDHVEIL